MSRPVGCASKIACGASWVAKCEQSRSPDWARAAGARTSTAATHSAARYSNLFILPPLSSVPSPERSARPLPADGRARPRPHSTRTTRRKEGAPLPLLRNDEEVTQLPGTIYAGSKVSDEIHSREVSE